MVSAGRMLPWASILISLHLLSSLDVHTITATSTLNSTSASLGSIWTTNTIKPLNFTDGTMVYPILVALNLNTHKSRTEGPLPFSFVCGFFCKDSTSSPESFVFGITMVYSDGNTTIIDTQPTATPQVVWSANRNQPIEGYAALRLMADGHLSLTDRKGNVVWSTTGQSDTVGMNLTDNGNLMLLDTGGGVVWQSFDHPTDVILVGQPLIGKTLVANASATNGSEGGAFYLNVTVDSYSAIINVNGTAKIYYSSTTNREVSVQNGVVLPTRNRPSLIGYPRSSYLRLEADGHLRLYEWSSDELMWKVTKEFLDDYRGKCGYPVVCGAYGICLNEECSCPQLGNDRNGVPYFQAENLRQPSRGCFQGTPISCPNDVTDEQILLSLEGISFYGFADRPDVAGTDLKSCKDACLNNCSCRAAFLKYGVNGSSGDCYLPTVIKSLIQNQSNKSGFNSSAFLKVQLSRSNVSTGSSDDKISSSTKSNRSGVVIILGSTIGSILFIVLMCICVIGIIVSVRKKRRTDEEEEEFQFTNLRGTPTKFSYEELRSLTNNFSRKLGEGGFGSVFEGSLDGLRIAVKVLGYRGQGMKEFVAEVESIGSINHLNLVRLVGFCSEKLHRLLVYEFMSNGSLEKWIFRHNRKSTLDWKTRFKIILDVGRGLSYLHEDCRLRIMHLDIKPQNILLDDDFSAKVSDFGLSKLVDRDQSQVMTTLRGTPGYLAPEWLSSTITEKVDVYSFGAVVLETISGMKCLDNSRPPGSVHLVSKLKKVAEENRLLDIVDDDCDGVETHQDEVLKVVRLAMWCLQNDHGKRPSMSMVVKVLEGLMDVECDLDVNFFAPAAASSSSSSSSLPI